MTPQQPHGLPSGRREHSPADRPPPTVRIAIRVKPGASRTKVGGSYGTGGAQAGGGAPAALVVAVSQRAVDGKATEAALKALADALGVARRKVRLVSGVTSRDKVVEVLDPPAGLADRLETLRAG